jgi:Protein of unknown function (DUF3551)
MKKVMTAAFALSALFAALGKAHADINYPWCIMGDTRGYECVFSTREQCMQDGRNRGFGGQCVQNPSYKPGKPTVSETLSPQVKRLHRSARAAGFTHFSCEKGYRQGPLCDGSFSSRPCGPGYGYICTWR